MWCSQAVSGPVLPPQAVQHQAKRARWTRCSAAGPAAAAGPLAGSLQAAAAAAAAALLLAAAPQPAAAENVRLEDVESSTLRAGTLHNAYFYRGLRAAVEGRLEDAERLFQVYLLNEDPQSASAHSNLGNVHQQQGKPELAVQDYTRAVELAPQAPVPYLNRAIAKETLGVEAAQRGDRQGAQALWRSAAEDASRAIELDPKEFAAYFDRGNIDMRLSNFDGALADFRKAADLAPGLAGYRLREATLLFQTGDTGGARRMIQGVVRKVPAYAEAHACLAAVDWAQGEGERAEEQFLRALEIEPRWGDVAWVKANTRWPPALEDAFARFLAIQGSG